MATYLNIARPYAQAVFSYAKEQGSLDAWALVLKKLAGLVSLPEIQKLLNHPGVGPEVVVSIFESCLSKTSDASVKRFLTLLAYKRRLIALSDIASLYLEQYRQEKKQTVVQVRSAFKLSESMTQRLKQVLAKQLDAAVELEVTVDSSLIGGAIISAEEFVIDGSIQGKLKKLSQALS